MTVGEKLLKLRKEKHLSQEEVAEKLNVTRQTISKWETDQSVPDFDKIMPICNLYNISPNELIIEKNASIKQKEDEIKANNVEIKYQNKRNILLLLTSVFLYFISVIWIIISEEVFEINDGITVSIFLFLCAIATCILIYYFNTGEKEENKKEEKNSLEKHVLDITGIVFLIIYLVVSFVTMAWHITWIIWIIYAIVDKIVELLFELRGDVNEKE